MEPRHLGGGVAELGQDLVGVLAEDRRRRPDRTPAWRTAGTARRPAGSTPQAGCSCSTVIPSASASGEANAARTSLIGPHGMSAASSAASQSAVERVAKRAASNGRSVARRSTRSPFVAKRGSPASSGSTERRAQPRPLPLRADRDGDRAVGGRERLVRHDVRVGVAEPPGRNAADERVLRLVHQAGEGRAEERDVDPLAVARRSRTRCARARPARPGWRPPRASR